MSLVIIPLAGPDLFCSVTGLRPLRPINERPLIDYVLGNRTWVRGGSDKLVFVVRDLGEPTARLLKFLATQFPHSRSVVLSDFTIGAPFSALAALAFAEIPDEPVIVDLADIAFDPLDLDVERFFDEHAETDGLIPYFDGNSPKFSYLELAGRRVVRTVEKQVISRHASAGVYIFRNAASYLKAITYILKHPTDCRVGEAMFVCPSLNGLITDNRAVEAIKVNNPHPISLLFHK